MKNQKLDGHSRAGTREHPSSIGAFANTFAVVDSTTSDPESQVSFFPATTTPNETYQQLTEQERDERACENAIHHTGLQKEVDQHWTPKKQSNIKLSNIYATLEEKYKQENIPEKEIQAHKRWERLFGCGSHLEFHVPCAELDDTPTEATLKAKSKLNRAFFCRDRLCPMCNWRRSLKLFGQISKIMNHLEEQEYRYLFLTLTIRNCSAEDLPETIQKLFDGWRFLYNKDKRFKAICKGACRILEVTVNNNRNDPIWYGSFHPHFHIILAVKPNYFKGENYIKQKDWVTMWQHACKLNYNPQVDIQIIKPKNPLSLINTLTDVRHAEAENTESSNNKRIKTFAIQSAVAEMSKYPVKNSDILHDEYREITSKRNTGLKVFAPLNEQMRRVETLLNGLTGRRLVDFVGCFRKARQELTLDDAEDGDLIHLEEIELREDMIYMLVRYSWRAGVYVRQICGRVIDPIE